MPRTPFPSRDQRGRYLSSQADRHSEVWSSEPPYHNRPTRAGFVCTCLAGLLASAAMAAEIDLRQATVVAPADLSRREQKAVTMLVEEVEKRSQIQWPVAASRPSAARPAVIVERPGATGPAEGYRVRVDRRAAAPALVISGNDSRGVLFGIGRVLRELRLSGGQAAIRDDLNISTAPRYPLRGHQLGYRPKTNSYDGWSLPMWEQYIRDLAVFGANAIELIPPRSDDDAWSPHFPLPPMEMMEGMSRLADDYGLDVWIWYPAMDPDYSDPKTVQFALDEWGEVFKRLPRIDAVFVPGGDPGHTQPKYLMALLEKETQVLHRYHPKAQMWVSPQSFNRERLGEFYDILQKQQPAWLSGVVFGPQVRASLPQLRAAVPKRYSLRHYPDITHSRQSQYPVPDWDMAYAATEAREVINPRPLDEARIFRLLQPYTIGFLAYSEGCNDDVNKAIWSALGWDPEADVPGILRQYARYFIGDRYTEDFAEGLLALERNWRGPLAANESVATTLERFRAMERSASPQLLLNWRFQQALYRAYYDAYTRSRLLAETAQQDAAMADLRNARGAGSLEAMASAEAKLDQANTRQPFSALRDRVFELGSALFESIRMQLSVPLYKAISVGRGANLDTIDMPLNDRLWLKQRFAEIRKMTGEPDRLRAIGEIVNWTNPGPGGYYDDLGNVTKQPHLIRGAGFEKDPAFLASSLVSFAYRPEYRSSWWMYAESLNDTPLQMRYTGLDRAAQYRVRVVYAGDAPGARVRLVANGSVEIHPLIEKPSPVRPVEFDIPAQATAMGELTLSWYRDPAAGGNGRGCQVAEVWLIKK